MKNLFILIVTCFISVVSLSMHAAIGDSPSAAKKLYGSPIEGQPNMLNVGGKHLHYKCALFNSLITVEAIFLDRECVGVRYATVPLATDENTALTPLVANKLLDENGSQSNWIWTSTQNNRREYIHKRFFYTATYDNISLTIWSKAGLLRASEAPLAE